MKAVRTPRSAKKKPGQAIALAPKRLSPEFRRPF